MAKKKRKQQKTDTELQEIFNYDEEAIAVYKTKRDAETFLSKEGWREGPISIEGIDFSTINPSDIKLKVSTPDDAKFTLDCIVNLMLNNRISAKQADVIVKCTEASMRAIKQLETDKEVARLQGLLEMLEKENE